MGFRKVWVETDSTECRDLIFQEHEHNHRDVELLTQVRAMLARDWMTKLTYVPRSCNNVADFLAKKGLEGNQGYQEIYLPSDTLQGLISKDWNGCNVDLGIY